MLKRILIFVSMALLVFGCFFVALVALPMRNPHPAPQQVRGMLSVRGARIYPSPDEAPLENSTLLVRDGRIVAVGPSISAPAGTRSLACNGCTIVAGYWNTHVHFTQPNWESAAYKPAPTLNAQLTDMLTSRGFTTVVDLGSDLRVTLSLRRRIEAGELSGPAIYTAGSGLYPPQGIPFYIKQSTPRLIQLLLPQPETPAEAIAAVRANIQRGADVLKLFTGSYVEHGRVLPMPVDIVRAAVTIAHEHHQIAFSHPSNFAGTIAARDGGVDILAHAPDSTEGVDTGVLQSLVDHKMSMVPTLKMFATTVTKKSEYLLPIYAEVRQFHMLGGKLLFGTDVGYMTDYTTEGEFDGLTKSGLGWQDILRMLTTEPAKQLGAERDKGTLQPGKLADFVILQGNPAADTKAFAQVIGTVRGGRILYSASPL